MEINAYIETVGRRAKETAAMFGRLSSTQKNDLLIKMADYLNSGQEEILAANRLDVEKGMTKGLSKALIDRLSLSPRRIESMAAGLRTLVALEDPVGGFPWEWLGSFMKLVPT
jgi:glutamate-5-semialdehyde dehydrogenase